MTNRAEQERRDLNKKLLKRTLASEFKARRKESVLEFVMEFIALFIAFGVSDWMVQKLSIHSWLIEITITVVLVMVVRYIELLLRRMLKKDKNGIGK